MISIDLPETLEKRFWNVVRDSYDGDLQTAMKAFLKLHEKDGWKEQFLDDAESLRADMRRRGGINEEMIEDAVQRYRRKCEYLKMFNHVVVSDEALASRLPETEFELSFSCEGDIYVDGKPLNMNVKERYESLVLR